MSKAGYPCEKCGHENYGDARHIVIVEKHGQAPKVYQFASAEEGLMVGQRMALDDPNLRVTTCIKVRALTGMNFGKPKRDVCY